MIKTQKPDRAWLKRARKAGITKRTGEASPLKKLLLDIGGWAAVIPEIEPDLIKILERGRRFPGKSRTMRGQPSRCHENSALCWEANTEQCSICTGYALSRDGVWRQHSWILAHDGTLVETTEKRVQYFGFVMTEEECQEFLDQNC
jgi:hypothetical protein